jgi:hypothetical protein
MLRAQSNSLSTSALRPCFTFVGPVLAGPAMLGSPVRVETRMVPGLASPVPNFFKIFSLFQKLAFFNTYFSKFSSVQHIFFKI